VTNHSQMTLKATSKSRAKRWIIFDIDFFNSIYENKFVVTEKFIEHTEKNIYFKDVKFFLKRMKNVAKVKHAAQIRENLFTCLKELTLQWYTSKLFENIKNLLRYDNDVRYWKKKLLKRFKNSASVAMTSLMKKKYTVKDAKRKRKWREYAEVILRAAKFVELISKISQIFLIYNEIDVKFQRDILMSKVDTKLNNFLTNLDHHKNVWWQLVERKRENSYVSSTNTQNQYLYEYIKYDNYQFEYQRYKNEWIDLSRYSAYNESQRYDQIYDNQEYQSRDFLSTYSNYSHDANKINFNFISF
jgi:hypothetical protein